MWSWVCAELGEKEVKDGSGFTRSRFVVRRAEDSWRRQEGVCIDGTSDGKRNGRFANGRRGAIACIACGEVRCGV